MRRPRAARTVDSPSPQHASTVESILTEPMRWRSAVSDGVTAEKLHEACFKLIKPKAGEALRTRLAQFVVHPDTPANYRERLGPWLAEPDPVNLGAQVVLHNSELLSSEAKTRFRETFARLNTSTFDQLLGTVSSAAQPFQFAPTRPVASSSLFASACKANRWPAPRPPAKRRGQPN